ncbi:hypothetical protein [Absidia glauca]|uniref:Uncharacterized protein n=1 Tax=Absidia glauca TaxID=4829 RepID=A0A163KRI1_ABSGL|nr:hypothetical protein [Absidia glauca]
MHMPLDCESKSEAHGGDKLMTLLKRKGKGDGLCLLTAMDFAFQTGRISIPMACACSYGLPEHTIQVLRHFIQWANDTI